MIAADTSALSAYFNDEPRPVVAAVRAALAAGQIVLPPVVVTEIISAPNADALEPVVAPLPTMPILDGYWLRAGRSRRLLLAKGLKAKVADALIAQFCIDHDLRLLAGDRDFRHFAKHCGLKLA
jgi:predicted nucleic acid-binding protein